MLEVEPKDTTTPTSARGRERRITTYSNASSPRHKHEPLGAEELVAVYTWVDSLPLSRPKRNIARDFSDGCLLAEILKLYFPSAVNIAMYFAATDEAKKRANFELLTKDLKSLGFNMSSSFVDEIVTEAPGVVEIVIYRLLCFCKRKDSRKAAMMPVDSQQSSYYEDTVRNTCSTDEDEFGERRPPSQSSSQKQCSRQTYKKGMDMEQESAPGPLRLTTKNIKNQSCESMLEKMMGQPRSPVSRNAQNEASAL